MAARVDPGTAWILGTNWTSEASYRAHSASVAPGVYGAAVVIGLLPTYVFLAYLCYAAVSSKRGKQSDTRSSLANRQMDKLRDAQVASRSIRLRVTFFLFQFGWLGVCTPLRNSCNKFCAILRRPFAASQGSSSCPCSRTCKDSTSAASSSTRFASSASATCSRR